jgi:iron complex outermembrane receptor protein
MNRKMWGLIPFSFANTFRALLILTVLPVSAAWAQESRQFDIPSQDAAAAIKTLALEADFEILIPQDLVNGKQANAISGRYTPVEALHRMLAGTGLSYRSVGVNAYVVEEGDVGVLPFAGSQDGAMIPPAPEGEITDNVSETVAAVAEPTSVLEEAPTTASVETVRRGGIEEVIVTARRREESIQDIPISVTALSTEDMKAFGIRNIADMEGIVPGLNMSGGGNGVKKDSNPFIRAVGTYIDGIFIARTAGAMFDVAGVESVQVLRGPQGTLFGRNTTGGAISITTKKPDNDWGAQLSSSIGNYGRSDVALAVNAPIIKDKLLSRLTVASVNSEGYFTNINDNSKWGDDNRITGIGQLRWHATDTLMFDVLGERTRIRETPRPQKCGVIRSIDPEQWLRNADGQYVDQNGNTVPSSQRVANPTFFNPTPIRSINTTRAQTGQPSFHELCEQSADLPQHQFASDMAVGDPLLPKARYWVDTSTWGLTGSWNIGDLGPISGLQAKSISAWRRVAQIADEDLDAVGASYLVRVQPDFTETTQLSQELQLTGRALNDRLFFSTGLYYFAEETPKDDLLLLAGIATGAGRLVNQSEINTYGFSPDTMRYGTSAYEPTNERLSTDNEAYAWFGQVDFDVTSQLQATMGLRYTEEKRWSRYDKAVALAQTVADGWFSGLTLNGLSTFAHTGHVNPILDWEYGARTFAQNPDNPNYYNVTVFLPGEFVGDELSTTDEAWTPMMSLKYSASEAVLDKLNLNAAMFYLTYSEGFHSGGVTAGAVDYDIGVDYRRNEDGSIWRDPVTNSPTQLPPAQGYGTADPVIFKPEKVKNYEIGLKLTGLDRRVQANLAAFYMDYTNMQLTSVGNRDGIPIPFIENAGKSSIQGLEAEFVLAPTPEWRVIANTSWTKADIKEWQSAQWALAAASGNPSGPPTYIDRSDEPMPRVPEWQAFLLTDYSFLLKGGSTLVPSIAFRYTSEIWHGFDRGSFLYGQDTVTSEKTTFIDGRVSWLSADGRMEIAAWGKNLTNEDDYLVGAIALADVTGASGLIYANPRTFGLNLTYNFGAR